MLSLISCNKTTQVEGTVYSTHHIPVPNARIILEVYTTASSYPTTTFEQKHTNYSGHYSFTFKANAIFKRYEYRVYCQSDSGHTYDRNLSKSVTNHIDFNLE